MSEQSQQLAVAATKLMEQGGAAIGGSLGLYQIIVQHKDIILILCTVGSFSIAVLGYLTSSLLNWYFKRQHLKLAQKQIRRKNDAR